MTRSGFPACSGMDPQAEAARLALVGARAWRGAAPGCRACWRAMKTAGQVHVAGQPYDSTTPVVDGRLEPGVRCVGASARLAVGRQKAT